MPVDSLSSSRKRKSTYQYKSRFSHASNALAMRINPRNQPFAARRLSSPLQRWMFIQTAVFSCRKEPTASVQGQIEGSDLAIVTIPQHHRRAL